MRPINVILTLEVLRETRVGPLKRNGADLSQKDTDTALDVYQQWLLLLVDLGYLSCETLQRDAGRLWTNLVQGDVLDLNNAFAELSHLIKVGDIRGFKALSRKISPHLYPLIKEDVLEIPNRDVYAARRLLQVFTYTSRLTLHDIDLTQQCLDDYMRIEDSIPDAYPSSITTALRRTIARWTKSFGMRPVNDWVSAFDAASLSPGHGPGGVAGHGRTTLEVKYKDLTSDHLLAYAFPQSAKTDDEIRSTLDRISQTIFVPKSYKTFRTISMESASLQYYQQAVWREIDRMVASSRYLRSRIGFHEQIRNQVLAKEGSLNRTYATIDLSAASDSVSYKLVKELFCGTSLYRYLVSTRSRKTLLPDGRLIELKKFAPMGSALCFPVETIIFASVCHLVTNRHGRSGDFSVFGDDIIVPTECAHDTMSVLTMLGFSPNADKSFVDDQCWYRESCGKEYCDGFDVTPLRVSRKYSHVDDVTRYQSWISVANECYHRNYRHLRLFFLRRIQAARVDVLFSPSNLLSDNYTNYHTKRRWNPQLQRIECYSHTLTATTEPGSEEIRYRHWLEKNHSRDFQPGSFFIKEQQVKLHEGFSSAVGKSTVNLKVRWMKKPFEEADQPFIDFFTTEGENLPLLS